MIINVIIAVITAVTIALIGTVIPNATLQSARQDYLIQYFLLYIPGHGIVVFSTILDVKTVNKCFK